MKKFGLSLALALWASLITGCVPSHGLSEPPILISSVVSERFNRRDGSSKVVYTYEVRQEGTFRGFRFYSETCYPVGSKVTLTITP